MFKMNGEVLSECQGKVTSKNGPTPYMKYPGYCLGVY